MNRELILAIITKNYLGQELWVWPTFVLLTLFIVVFFRKVLNIAANHLETFVNSKSSPVLNHIATLLRTTRRIFLFVFALWISALIFDLPGNYPLVHKFVVFVFILQLTLWIDSTLQAWISWKMSLLKNESPARLTSFGTVRFLLRFALWLLSLLLVLDNFGFNITTLVAGLGIGGIAIALAVQNILGDLLCSISILLDKPFEVGDFIIVDDVRGIVTHIGIKSIRIKSLTGEEIVISNSDLISNRIKNYKKMQERRISFSIGVVYQTTQEQLEKIPELLKEAVIAQESVRFDRAHFKSFGAYSLDFEVVYYVLSGDYNTYMDIQQQINYRIFSSFAQTGIEFAYPTQSVFVTNQA